MESSNNSIDKSVISGANLTRQQSISISPELFEKLYLSPQNAVKGGLRNTFGNPTPLALVGFIVALSPISAELMGWRGATGAAATIGANIWFGGFLLILSGLLEFLLGNTFPSVVFFGYGAHFLTYGTTFQPFYNAVAAYNKAPTSATALPSQALSAGFASSFAFYACFMGVLSFIFLVCSLRTNVVFVFIFTGAMTGFILAAASFWTTAQGLAVGATLLKGAGGCFFVAALMGWYLLLVILTASVDMPFFSTLPVGDLSTTIKGKSEKKA